MSSPTVLTFVPTTLHEARGSNCREAETFLALAAAVLTRTRAKAAALRAQGTSVPDPLTSIDDARLQVQQLLATGDGSAGLRFAHAYYQELKHPWADLVDKMSAEVEAEAEIARLRADYDERERVASVAKGLTLRCGLPAVEMLATAVGTSVDEMVAARLSGVVEIALAADPGRNVDALGQEVVRVLASITHAEQKVAVLDALRLQFEEQLSKTKRRAALASLLRDQAERSREILRIRARSLYAELEPLTDADETRFSAELARIVEAIGSVAETELELRIDALRAEIATARARKSVYELVVKALRRQGYDEIAEGPSEALGPAAIRRRYFRRPGDAERLVEFAHGDDNALSVETVRVHEGSFETKQADREAQQELCSVMKHVTAAMDEAWRTVVVHEGAVGETMAVRKELEAVAQREPARLGRPAQRTRSIA